jgi:homogentisate phytyltransferase/homogentisate geranylgeranyltransferase
MSTETRYTRTRLTVPLPPFSALWAFSRPHTIIGTTVSVFALYAIALANGIDRGALDLLATLAAAWAVNVAIVGINQVEDVEIDRINKPDLPLAAGTLTIAAGQALSWGAALFAVGLALSQGTIEFAAVSAALVVGFSYSLPPLRLKGYPVLALASISLVRALAVNLGVYGHFSGSLASVPDAVWALTAFSLPFGAAIALLKDVPDIEGDRAFRISTFSVRLGARAVARTAIVLLAASYIAMAAMGLVLAGVDAVIFSGGHLIALVALLLMARGARPEDPRAFKRFYMQVWMLFFFEYVLVAAAVVL